MFFKVGSLIRNKFLCTQTPSHILKRKIKDLSFYEPPYLETTKPKFPHYDALTVQIKGYDYPALENFQKFAHSIATYMNISVDQCWAQPAKHFEVQRFKALSNVVDSTYKIIIYERNIKIVDVDSSIFPLFVEFLQAAIPEGSTLNVFPFDPEHEKDRYVPDHDLKAKLKELEDLGGPPDGSPPPPV